MYGEFKLSFYDFDRNGEKSDETDHEEVELLLEAYAADLNHISSEANRMKVALDDTDDFVNTHLSTMRNKIIRMSLFMEMGMFSIAVPALLAGEDILKLLVFFEFLILLVFKFLFSNSNFFFAKVSEE